MRFALWFSETFQISFFCGSCFPSYFRIWNLLQNSWSVKHRRSRLAKKGSSLVLGDGHRESCWIWGAFTVFGCPLPAGVQTVWFWIFTHTQCSLEDGTQVETPIHLCFMLALPDLILYIFRVLVFWRDSSQEVKYRIFHLWHHVNLKFRSVSDEDAHVVYTVSNPILLLVPWLNLQLTTLTWGSPPACLKPHSPSSFHGVWFSSRLPCCWGCYHSLGHAQTMSSSRAHLPSDLHISLVTKSCLVCFQNSHTVTLSLKPWTPLPPTKWF